MASKPLRILAIHSANHPVQEKRSAVDRWRLQSKLVELRKLCPDWTIDERLTIIPDIEGYGSKKEFTEEEMNKAFGNICHYDIVLTSYQSNPTFYILLKVAEKRANVQYIMDVDDNMFAIDPNNPVWAVVSDENVYHMQCMIRDNTWISTTTEALADEFRKRRKGHHKDTVLVSPNYINDEYQAKPPDNGDKVVIGFFGGSSHYGDLHNTGVLDALKSVMHENKNVYFKSVGIPIDKYLPKARVTVGDARKGDAWLKEIYPNLQLDIAIGPLEDTPFNKGKSNIKYLESTRAGSAFVASRIGPYKDLSYKVARTVSNSAEDWYKALSDMVANESYRKSLVAKAQKDIAQNYRLETHIQEYADMLTKVYETGKMKARDTKKASPQPS